MPPTPIVDGFVAPTDGHQMLGRCHRPSRSSPPAAGCCIPTPGSEMPPSRSTPIATSTASVPPRPSGSFLEWFRSGAFVTCPFLDPPLSNLRPERPNRTQPQIYVERRKHRHRRRSLWTCTHLIGVPGTMSSRRSPSQSATETKCSPYSQTRLYPGPAPNQVGPRMVTYRLGN
jgi:hypothetical protein